MGLMRAVFPREPSNEGGLNVDRLEVEIIMLKFRSAYFPL